MNEQDLRGLIEDVRRGRLSRRAFARGMVALGLTAPMATQMLAYSGIAVAAEPPPYKPTKAGGGGPLKVLWWQGPTLLNPHFAVGTKDQDGSRIFYEPLATWNADGSLAPVLAAQIPTIENGGLTEEGTSVTWKLKQGVKWHDGQPFTADDCVFNWEYAADPATAATTIGSLPGRQGQQGRRPHHQVGVQEADAVLGRRLRRRQRHDHPEAPVPGIQGAKSREAPANLSPVGTGPYQFVDFKPGDLVQGKLNPNYHMPNRPYLRHDRDEGWRRRGVGRARGAADRRVRLRLEHAGRGRDPQAPRGERQGPRRNLQRWQHRAYPAQQHRSLARG